LPHHASVLKVIHPYKKAHRDAAIATQAQAQT
jgi:hypothetical protein